MGAAGSYFGSKTNHSNTGKRAMDDPVDRKLHQQHQQRLNAMLDAEADTMAIGDGMEVEQAADDGPEDLNAVAEAAEGMCVECTDQTASVRCDNCQDDYCDVCFQALHRRGNRKNHVSARLHEADAEPSTNGNGPHVAVETAPAHEVMGGLEEARALHESGVKPLGDWFVERARYIPLRLSYEERKYLRLLEATLNVSEYTDRVDVIGFMSAKGKRIIEQVRDICAILSGLLLAADYKAGQRLVSDREFKDNAEFFQTVFEIGRRYKILNPERMRASYGKLVYFLQDTQMPEIQELLEFQCVRPLQTVYTYLESKGLLDVLRNPHIEAATRVITPEGKTRIQVQREIAEKNRAVKYLARKYADRRSGVDEDDIELCLYSMADNNTFLYYNRDPCDQMLNYLSTYFRPDTFEEHFSLAIVAGRHGARLTHSHNRQYNYVLQSLTLWREILHDFFKLWYLAEEDLLCEQSPYRLRDTGQGLNRMQACPKTLRLMHAILAKAQGKVEYWVGSSVVHMGDHNVPNALMFIDKYTQVARILTPVALCLRKIDALHMYPGLEQYILQTYGGPENCKKTILSDFFRHGFDGSGADNFFDAGSCIDGRLTSAWNWCSTLEKKPFYPVFLLTGFVGFDGQFA